MTNLEKIKSQIHEEIDVMGADDLADLISYNTECDDCILEECYCEDVEYCTRTWRRYLSEELN